MSLLLPIFQPDYNGKFAEYIKYTLSLFNINYNIINLSIFIFIIFLSKFIISVFQEYKYHKISNIFLSNIRKKIVDIITHADYLKVNKYSFSEINNLLTKETEKAYELFFYIMQISVVCTLMIGYLSMAFFLNVKYTLVMIIFGIFIMLVYKKLNRKVKYYSYEILNKSERINKYLTELIVYLKYLKVTNCINTYNKYMKESSDEYSHIKYKQAFLGGLTKRSSEPIGILMILLMVSYNNIYEGKSNIEIAFVALFLYKVFTTFTNFQYMYQKILAVHASTFKIIDFENTLKNSQNKNNENKIYFNELLKTITLNNLSFKIENKKIIDNISYKFERSKIYGIVGNTGAGKTTLINLISGLYIAEDNCMKYNNTNVNQIDIRKLSEKIAYVSQENFVFEDTLLNNIISWNKEYEKDVEQYIKISALSKLVDDLGLESNIGSFGTTLSGGQKQRICLARELIKQPDVLILDEATSALDANTEKEIMGNIISLKDDKITFVIAHRLSTLFKMDEIIFLKNGKIEASGNFFELYHTNCEFKKMCNNQNINLDNE
nr:ABC transporter ATP-binding protein [Halarcobacter ebronensis]